MEVQMPQLSTVFARVREPILAALHKATGQDAPTSSSQATHARNVMTDLSTREAKNRLATWVNDGVRVQGGMNILTRAELAQLVPKPERGVSSEVNSAYLSLVEKVDSAFLAMHTLDDINIREFSGSPLPPDANTALIDAVQAQHSLFQAAKEFQQASGREEPALVRLMADSQARASELLNFAGRMIGANKAEGQGMNAPEGMLPLAENSTVLQAAQSLVTTMHGTDNLLESLAAQAETLFTQVNTLADDNQKMSASAFADQLIAVKQGIITVQKAVDSVLSPVIGETPTLLGDTQTFTALNKQFEAALARLDILEGKPDFQEVARNYAGALTQQPSLWELADALPIPESIKDILGTLDSEAANIKNMLLPYAGTNFNIASVSRELVAMQDELKIHAHVCRTFAVLAFADADAGIVNTAEEYMSAISSRLPFLSEDEVDVLGNDLADTVNALVDDEGACARFEEFKGAISHSIFNLSPAQVRAEVRELKHLAARGLDSDVRRGAYIAKAFENNFSMATLAEVSARGIDSASVDFIAHDGALTQPPTALGSGACNAVLLCTYKDARGMEVQRVFKGEVPARRGLVRLNLGKLGYDPLVRVAQLNVATKQVAAAIQCGDVVSQATVGVHAGKFGLFMECAPGKTAAAFDGMSDDDYNSPVATTKDGVPLSPPQLFAHLRAEGLMEKAQANMQRELFKLEWADLLCGQGDRHQENYLVNIDPNTAQVRVTGIDNDASFGRRMVGAAQVEVTSSVYAKLHDLAKPVMRGEVETLVVDMAQLNDNDKLRVRNVFGFNQMSVPELIDKSTFDALMAINDSDYVEMLSKNLDPEAIRSALLRLHDAKSLALDLEVAGRVITDWEGTVAVNAENPAGEQISITTMLDRMRSAAMRSGDSASLGFYARDFATLLQ